MQVYDRPGLLCHSLISAGSVASQLALVVSVCSAHQRALSVTRSFSPCQDLKAIANLLQISLAFLLY